MHRLIIFLTEIKDNNKNKLGENRFYFLLQLPGHTLWLNEISAGIQGRNLEAGTKAEAMEEPGYGLSPHGLLSLYLEI